MKNYIKLSIAAGLAIILALVFYFKTLKLPDTAAFLPRILIVLIILLSVGMVIESYYKDKKNVQNKRRIDERAEEDEVETEEGTINYKRASIFVLMIATYIFTMKYIGYFIVTPVFILSVYIYVKATKVKNMIMITAGFTVFVYLLFVVFLKLPIPMGLLK